MPKLVHRETMCCGSKRCPTVEIFEDGSIEISDDDSENGSIGRIKLRPETVDRLASLITKDKAV